MAQLSAAGAATALLLGAAAGVLAPPAALAAESATIVEILDGNQIYIQRQPARVRQRADAPEVISTGDSRGQLTFSSGAAGRLNRFSLLRLGTSCFLMEKGQLLVSGKQNGCTRSARLSVRGTNYLVEVQEDGSSEISVLEGSVEVEPLRNGEPTGEPATTVAAGNRLRLSPLGAVLALLRLNPEDYTTILNGPLFSGFTTRLPGFASLESYLRSAMPSVTLPSAPVMPTTPVLPSIPRFGLF